MFQFVLCFPTCYSFIPTYSVQWFVLKLLTLYKGVFTGKCKLCARVHFPFLDFSLYLSCAISVSRCPFIGSDDLFLACEWLTSYFHVHVFRGPQSIITTNVPAQSFCSHMYRMKNHAVQKCIWHIRYERYVYKTSLATHVHTESANLCRNWWNFLMLEYG